MRDPSTMLPHPDRMDLSACRYIVIEGPIGAGKTSLARELAHRLHAD
jgi:tRNA A37 threonylcarbamoyladenosine biosynthesis protein TsaE